MQILLRVFQEEERESKADSRGASVEGKGR